MNSIPINIVDHVLQQLWWECTRQYTASNPEQSVLTFLGNSSCSSVALGTALYLVSLPPLAMSIRVSPFSDFLSSRSHSVELDEAAVHPSLASPPASFLDFLEPQIGSSSPRYFPPELDAESFSSTLSNWEDLPNPVRSVKVEPVNAISGEQNTRTDSPSVPGARTSHKTEHSSTSPLSSSNDARSAYAPLPPPSPRQILEASEVVSGRTKAHTPPPLSFAAKRNPQRISEGEPCTDNRNFAQRVTPSVRLRLITARSPSVSPSGKTGRTSNLPLIKIEEPQTDDDLPLPPITALARESDDSEYECSEGEEEKEDSDDELSPSEAEEAPEAESEPLKIIIKLKRKRDEVQQDTSAQDRKRRKVVQEPTYKKPQLKHKGRRYCCTLDGCHKTFARKNDLKRHEQMANQMPFKDINGPLNIRETRDDDVIERQRSFKQQTNMRLKGR
ncbi:hypothetical protein BDZ89DRAFT_1042269 [Hymenopellis radicata]|nr:hypothetical protein BDZ89DRAFT_1042269 [Hymenopellis radicata]